MYHVIELPVGRLKGCRRTTVYNEEYFGFEGIPYAQPPLGELRFKAPLPAKPWQGTRNCCHCSVRPIQMIKKIDVVTGKEDCLYLNVFVKKLDTEEPLPVLIWIYGGAFYNGDCTTSSYGPDYFMHENVVLVTFNYRLCALGFLSIKDPSLGIPGNAGLKDQILALKWVKNYISFFNGDPNNITVFGESAGGASTQYLASTPLTKGLFHKAICMSGCMLNDWAVTPQTNHAYLLAKVYGYLGKNIDRDVVAFLQNLKSKQLARHNILTKKEKRNGIMFTFGPCIEAYVGPDCVIAEEPRKMLRKAWGNNIPMIIGGTSDEGYIMYPIIKSNSEYLTTIQNDVERLLPFEVRERNKKISCTKAKTLRKVHFKKRKHIGASIPEFLDFFGLKFFWHGIHRTLLSRLHNSKAPTYLYRFAFDSPHFNNRRIYFCGEDITTGAAHADDISYLFCHSKSTKLETTSMEYKTIRRMIKIFTSFAKSSNPNCDETENLNWQPVTLEQPDFGLSIAGELSLAVIPEKKKLKVWDSLYKKKKLF